MGLQATERRPAQPGRSSITRRPLSAAIALALGVGVAQALHAATLTVNSTADSGAGSLRAAVAAAAPGDTINFSLTLPATITLTSGQIPITRNLTVTGPGATSLTLTKSGADARIFDITGGPAVTISGITFTGAGGATIRGGAIAAVNSSLTIQSSVFSNNVADRGGGALYSTGGPLTIQSSTFSGNTVGAVNGGGSDGGALYIRQGNVTIQDSTITGNRTGNDGGGIYHAEGTLSITNSTISNNQAQYGSAISRFCGNCNTTYSNNSTTITNSTITGNSTFAGYTSATQGGALFFYNATHTINNSTIANNSAPAAAGGNITLNGTATANLVSTIVSGGTDASGNRDLFRAAGSTFNASNSLVQNSGGFLNGTVTATITGQNPLLQALASNGGPTQTMALGAGSPAVDTGSNPLALTTDQRGVGFARTLGLGTDIGAFESGAAAPVVATAVPTMSTPGLALLAALLGALGFGGLRRRRRSDAS